MYDNQSAFFFNREVNMKAIASVLWAFFYAWLIMVAVVLLIAMAH